MCVCFHCKMTINHENIEGQLHFGEPTAIPIKYHRLQNALTFLTQPTFIKLAMGREPTWNRPWFGQVSIRIYLIARWLQTQQRSCHLGILHTTHWWFWSWFLGFTAGWITNRFNRYPNQLSSTTGSKPHPSKPHPHLDSIRAHHAFRIHRQVGHLRRFSGAPWRPPLNSPDWCSTAAWSLQRLCKCQLTGCKCCKWITNPSRWIMKTLPQLLQRQVLSSDWIYIPDV